jgi:hypothetical protein
MADKYFSRREAEEILPLVGTCLGEALEHKKKIEELDEVLSRAAAKIMMLGGSVPDLGELSGKRTQREGLVADLQKAITQIQEMGCLVKDLDMGLVDFPSLRDGEEVYLCWKFGEKGIRFYHGIDEGFAGRKPLDDSGTEEEPPHLQ